MKSPALCCALVALAGAPAVHAQTTAFEVAELGIDEAGDLSIEVPTSAESYYLLFRHGTPIPIDAALPADEGDSSVTLRDRAIGDRDGAIYHAEQVSFDAAQDVDGDGIDDLFELRHPQILNPLDATDGVEDGDEDGDSNLAEYLASTDPAELIVSEVSFVTSDGITIRGTLRRVATRPAAKVPMLILIHQGFRLRSEWNPFVPAFSAAGYSSLAYNIRGHGDSGGSFTSADFDNPNTSPRDLEAALAFVRGLPNTDGDRIGIVGSSVGGNLACVASQKRWAKTAVNISGKTSAVRNLAAESSLALESMFHIASSGDGGGQRAAWANELYGFTSGSRQVEVVPASSAHGVAVITASTGLLDRIVTWLDETL